MQGHCYSFRNSKLLDCSVQEHIRGHIITSVIPNWKGIHTVKMSLRWLSVALLLTTISVPALFAGTDGNPTGPPPVFHPPDGNPTGPPPHMML
jgi:hypothetical protein